MGKPEWMRSVDQVLEEIVQVVRSTRGDTPPFTFVLGAGMSRGLVPVTEEQVRTHIPAFIMQREQPERFAECKELSCVSPEDCLAVWNKLQRRNPSLRERLLPGADGFPKNVTQAYLAVFDNNCDGGLGMPAEARAYHRRIIQLDKLRINPAHLFLAALLAETMSQPGLQPISRLLLTTNFDPYLQVALQYCQQLYFMSDRPDLDLDRDYDPHNHAVHIVYVHGSIHRTLQAANTYDIQQVKHDNKEQLKRHLTKSGVIVLGFAGWEDALSEALLECDTFERSLFWLGMEEDPLAQDPAQESYRSRILQKGGRPVRYARIEGANEFMADLYYRLRSDCGGPVVLCRPLCTPIAQLEALDIPEVEPSQAAAPLGILAGYGSVADLKRDALAKLGVLSKLWTNPSLLAEVGTRPDAPDWWPDLLQRFQTALRLGKHDQVVALIEPRLGEKLEPQFEGSLRVVLGAAFFSLGNHERATEEWSRARALGGSLDGVPPKAVEKLLAYVAILRKDPDEARKAAEELAREQLLNPAWLTNQVLQAVGKALEESAKAAGGLVPDPAWLTNQVLQGTGKALEEGAKAAGGLVPDPAWLTNQGLRGLGKLFGF